MHLTIDIGNTTTKTAIHPTKSHATDNPVAHNRIDGHNLTAEYILHTYKDYNIDAVIISSTVEISENIREEIKKTGIPQIIYLNHTTPIPISNLYSTPQTLGMDRLAATIGAYFLSQTISGQTRHVLTIDVGTAITYDFITENAEYLGGNISPGIDMRFKALHHFTDKLPLIGHTNIKPSFIGNSTETAIVNGVMNGVKYEIYGVIDSFCSKYPNLLIFLTGGNHIDFDEPLKNRIFADDFLVHKGLNIILKYNLQQ